MRHRGPGYHNLCVLSCLAPVVNINIKIGINTKQQGTKEVLTPQRLYIKSLSSLSLPKWSSMTGLCPKQSSGSGLAQSLWPLFLNFWNEIAQLKDSIPDAGLCLLSSTRWIQTNAQKPTPAELSLAFCVAVLHDPLPQQRCATMSFETKLCTKGKLKCRSTSFHSSEEHKETKYCPPPFSSISLSSLTPLPSSLSVLFLLLLQMCVCIFHFILVIISHPAGREPCIRRSYSRAS